MSATGRILTWVLRLPPATTPNIVVKRDIPVPMPDGVELLADLYMPRREAKRATILVRSPYGRAGFFGALCARVYAERGWQVLIQSCRGTAGSGGEFVFARHEHDDGLATIAWIKQQPWFAGGLVMLGPSYLGFVQWAVVADAGADIKAFVPQVTSADFNNFRFPNGSFALENVLGWSTMMTEQAATGPSWRSLLGARTRQRLLAQAYQHLPLDDADRLVVGGPSASYQDPLHHGPDDPYWQPVDYSARVGEVAAPAYLMAGWYDLFLDWQLRDYAALRAAGRNPYLLIGPWTHGEFPSLAAMTRETLTWLRAQVTGDRSTLRPDPVRLLVMGTNEWRDFPAWPPPATLTRWYLQPDRALAPVPPPVTEPDHYRYDPADPTPGVGGNSLGAPEHMGRKDQGALEARSDVLVYTSEPLDRDLEIIGQLRAELYVRSSLEYTDFFVRLCVVDKAGKSTNLCDGIARLCPGQDAPDANGIRRVGIAIWPTAYHFRAGERIRVQVSSGAHPIYVRNLGTDEPLATGTTMQAADQAVYHDPDHPSAVVLPVLNS